MTSWRARSPGLMLRRASFALVVVASMIVPASARAQALTVSPSSSRADTIPWPKRADYDAGVSGSTATWTVRMTCPNSLGGQVSACSLRLQAPSGTLASVQAIVQTPTGGAPCSGGGQTFTVGTAAIEVMRVQKGGGNGNSNPNTCDVVMSFRASNVSYTAYPSSGVVATSTFTRSVSITATAIP